MTSKTLLIIGGVAGGASAAARARRLDEGLKIILVERGEAISFANCGLPYHIGGEIEDRDDLIIQTPQRMKRRFNIDVLIRTEALSIDRQAKAVRLRDLASGQEREQAYDLLLLSPGAEPLRPPIPGLELPGAFTLRNLADMDRIKALVDAKPQGRALVIGGGYIGLEMAEALRLRGMQVALVEAAPQVMGPADPEMAFWLHEVLREQGVDLRLSCALKGLAPGGASGLLADLGGAKPEPFDLALAAIGVKPESKLAREAGLRLGRRGGIVVDASMRTEDPSIWAVGDAVEVVDLVSGKPAQIPLAGPANRQGRIAADSMLGRASAYKGTQGTAICKLFDTAIAMTGLSEKALKDAGIACEKVYLHPAHHAGYYPGAEPMHLKLLFDPQSGRILGAQAVGGAGVDKRIDVLAVALRAGLTVRDLQDLELSYAPPFGSAKDPVNFAGFLAGNALDGDVALCHSGDVSAPKVDQLLLDVRTPAEFKEGAIPGAINIPVDDLRRRLAELPKDKELLVNCQVGLRGYLACRILSQNGFRCRNLSGGYLTYLSTV
jgi:NADPH-dependent 2,4-dienoyl-CoA reductase/sulfur reductase-like enzyme/rhodanese-related sulfurtransferase